MHGHYHYGCEEYCEDCLPVSPNCGEVDFDSGEQDTPANCCHCHRPLDYSLTTDGVEYVIDAIRRSIRDGAARRQAVHDPLSSDPTCGSYYQGSRACEVVRDWAKDLENYSLTGYRRILISEYLALTEEKK